MSPGRGTASSGSNNMRVQKDDFVDDSYGRSSSGNLARQNYDDGGRSRNNNYRRGDYRDEGPPRNIYDQYPPHLSQRSVREDRGPRMGSRQGDSPRGDDRSYGGRSQSISGGRDAGYSRNNHDFSDRSRYTVPERSNYDFRNNTSSQDARNSRESERTFGGPPREYQDDTRNHLGSGRGGYSNDFRDGVHRNYGFENNYGRRTEYQSGHDDRSRLDDRRRYDDGYGGHRTNLTPPSRNYHVPSGPSVPSYRNSPRENFSDNNSREDRFPRTYRRGGTSMMFPRGESRNINGFPYDQRTSNDSESRAPHTYRPEDPNIQAIFKEDREIAEVDSVNMGDDAEIDISGVPESEITLCERWEDMEICQSVQENIIKSGYIRPRKVQQYTIPFIIDGYDCKVQCETGSGKTAAFLIPIIHFLVCHKEDGYNFASSSPVALIVAPTRELVNQLYDQARKFASDTGISVARVYGEYNMRDNAQEIRKGCNIIVACLGRLMHFVREGTINLGSVRYIVLDEADRLMLENSNQEVIELLKWSSLPRGENRQTMLFSATLQDQAVMKLSTQFLRKHVVQITAKATSNKRVKYEVHSVQDQASKHKIIIDYIRRVSNGNSLPRILIFVNKKIDTDRVANALTIEGFNSTTIHGDRGQHLREEAMRSFRDGKTKILVATDVCARGVDIKDLDYVINFDLPNDRSTFIQRCGRTGRTHKGTAMSFYYEPDDRNIAQDIVQVMEDTYQDIPGFLLRYVSQSSYNLSNEAPTRNGSNLNNDRFVDIAPDIEKVQINDKDDDNGWG